MKKFTKPRPEEVALGQRIEDARGQCTMTVRAFALKMSVSERVIYDWEGGRKRPSPERLQAIAEILKVDFLVLRDGPEKWARTLASTQAPVDPSALSPVPYDEAMAAAEAAGPYISPFTDADSPAVHKIDVMLPGEKRRHAHKAAADGTKHPRPAPGRWAGALKAPALQPKPVDDKAPEVAIPMETNSGRAGAALPETVTGDKGWDDMMRTLRMRMGRRGGSE